MPVTNYYSLDGEIIGEETGGTRTDYLTDALGSVTATLDQTATIVNTYTYKPYGAQLAKTGVAADPAFLWNGANDYRQTNNKWSDMYVQARHYDDSTGRWTTLDANARANRMSATPSLFIYVVANPISLTDRRGTEPDLGPSECKRRFPKKGDINCFNCAYWYWIGHTSSGAKACELAKRLCNMGPEIDCSLTGDPRHHLPKCPPSQLPGTDEPKAPQLPTPARPVGPGQRVPYNPDPDICAPFYQVSQDCGLACDEVRHPERYQVDYIGQCCDKQCEGLPHPEACVRWCKGALHAISIGKFRDSRNHRA